MGNFKLACEFENKELRLFFIKLNKEYLQISKKLENKKQEYSESETTHFSKQLDFIQKRIFDVVSELEKRKINH